MKTSRLLHYSAFIIHFALASGVFAPMTLAQRADNRHLFWTGGDGATWDASAASWATTSTYLGALSGSSATWVTGADDPPAPLALPATAFLAGDSVVFDSLSDGANAANRTIAVAAGGVTVSDMVVSGTGNYILAGGAITAAGSSVAAGSVQLGGSGVAPGGRLVVTGPGTLTLANSSANDFRGGIVLTGGPIAENSRGALVIANTTALGNNNISTLFVSQAAASYVLPGVVTDSNGSLLRTAAAAGTIYIPTLVVLPGAAGLDITGDIYLGVSIHFDIEGDTTISGRITGPAPLTQIANGGTFIKTGDGTLTITGERNWFLGPNTVESGTLVITHPGALGMGNLVVNSGATFVLRDIRDGANFPQAITGGGRVEVIDSDMTLNYRYGNVIGAPAAANSNFSRLAVTRSRLHMLASGTLSSGLGGSASAVTVADHSTLVLGREGIVPGVSGLVAQINYPINARTLAIDATSALVLNPGANLTVTGTLALDPASSFTLGGSGLMRLEYAALAPGSASPDALAGVPAGYSLDTTFLTGNDGLQRRDYLVVNQGANPMHDVAMTAGAIDTIINTVADRLNELFLMPASEPTRHRQSRKWANIAWARYFSSAVDYETASASRPGHNGRLDGLVLGVDSAYRQRVNLGLHGGLTQGRLDTTNDTSLLSKQRYYGASITPRFKRFYLSVDLFSGNADSESLRREPNGDTSAHWTNNFRGGGIEAGFVLRPWKDGFLRPRLGMRLTRIDVKGYTERAPAGASPVVVRDFTDTLARLNLAIEAARRFKLLKRDMLAGVALGYKSCVRAPRATLDTAFRDYPERGFTLERGDYYENAFSLGASLHMVVTLRTRAGLALDYERGSSHDRLTASAVLSCIW